VRQGDIPVARSYSFPITSLTLEITETSAIQNPVEMLESLGRLVINGAHLSVDDFGAGFSNLTRVATLPISELKIDAEIVTGASDDRAYRTVLDVSRRLAADLGVHVVAEGIESETERALFDGDETVSLQGYLIARPLKADDARDFIAARKASVGPATEN